jgi:hypothetical protein
MAAAAPARAEVDEDGPMVSAGLTAGFPLLGADVSLGWQPRQPIAILGRAALVLANDRFGWIEAGLAARWWPDWSTSSISFALHAGLAHVSEEYDCILSTPMSTICTGGDAFGLAWGTTMRVAMTRNDDASLDLQFGFSLVHWNDASDGQSDGAASVRAGLGVSFY